MKPLYWINFNTHFTHAYYLHFSQSRDCLMLVSCLTVKQTLRTAINHILSSRITGMFLQRSQTSLLMLALAWNCYGTFTVVAWFVHCCHYKVWKILDKKLDEIYQFLSNLWPVIYHTSLDMIFGAGTCYRGATSSLQYCMVYVHEQGSRSTFEVLWRYVSSWILGRSHVSDTRGFFFRSWSGTRY